MTVNLLLITKHNQNYLHSSLSQMLYNQLYKMKSTQINISINQLFVIHS